MIPSDKGPYLRYCLAYIPATPDPPRFMHFPPRPHERRLERRRLFGERIGQTAWRGPVLRFLYDSQA